MSCGGSVVSEDGKRSKVTLATFSRSFESLSNRMVYKMTRWKLGLFQSEVEKFTSRERERKKIKLAGGILDRILLPRHLTVC